MDEIYLMQRLERIVEFGHDITIHRYEGSMMCEVEVSSRETQARLYRGTDVVDALSKAARSFDETSLSPERYRELFGHLPTDDEG